MPKAIKKPVVKKRAKKPPIGRPSKYDPKYCDMLIAHMENGLSFESFAGLIRVSKQTLYEWLGVHKAFSDAKDMAFEVSRLFWERTGNSGLWHGGKDGQNFNSTVWVFNMKNRFKWKDRVETTHATSVPITISYDPKKKKEE